MNLQGQETPATESKPLIKSYNGNGRNVILGITGTSGAIYGLRMLRALLINGFNVDIILSGTFSGFTGDEVCCQRSQQSRFKIRNIY